jgi:hypothetical protein
MMLALILAAVLLQTPEDLARVQGEMSASLEEVAAALVASSNARFDFEEARPEQPIVAIEQMGANAQDRQDEGYELREQAYDHQNQGNCYLLAGLEGVPLIGPAIYEFGRANYFSVRARDKFRLATDIWTTAKELYDQ